MNDIRSGIPGIGGAGFDIYTKLAPGAAPPPPTPNYIVTEAGDTIVTEGGDPLIVE